MQIKPKSTKQIVYEMETARNKRDIHNVLKEVRLRFRKIRASFKPEDIPPKRRAYIRLQGEIMQRRYPDTKNMIIRTLEKIGSMTLVGQIDIEEADEIKTSLWAYLGIITNEEL